MSLSHLLFSPPRPHLMSEHKEGTALVINKMSRIASFTSVQGDIGAGKSTFIGRLRRNVLLTGQCAITSQDMTKEDYYLVIDEPVDEWTKLSYTTNSIEKEKEDLNSILKIFYGDMRRWGFAFQVNAFNSRLRRIMKAIDMINPNIPATARIHIIAERSLRTDYLFFRNLYESGLISQLEFQIYVDFYHSVCDDTRNKETGMIYLKADPETCFQRIQKRDREAETSCCKTAKEEEDFRHYLVSLDRCHDQMVEAFRREKGEDKVYVIDTNENFSTVESYDSVVAQYRRSLVTVFD